MNDRKKIDYGKLLLGVFAGVVFFYQVIPSLLSVPMSFTDTSYLIFPPRGFSLQWHQNLLTNEKWFQPILFSLELALVSTAISLVIGTMASLALVRGIIPGKRVLRLFFLSPMIIPLIITAFAMYGLFAKLHLLGTLLGMALGHTIISCPFAILMISANLFRFDLSMELAARNLGASAFKAFMYVTLPIIKPGMFATAVFCFIISLDEMVLALFLMGTTKFTLPLRMFNDIRHQIDPTVAAASTIFIIAAVGTILALTFIKKEKK